MLPLVKLGNHHITRLIIGGNPFSGNSHISQEISDEMMDYFNTENIKKVLHQCEEYGINVMQTRADKHIIRLNREYWNEGGTLKWIAQTASEIIPFENNVMTAAKNNAIGIFLHGTTTDALFKNGDYQEILRKLRIIRESGSAVGLGTHMPEVVEYSEEHNWDVDFYMACVYNLSKISRVSSEISGKMNEDEPFDDEDREKMYNTIRLTPKPCLAFKILGAGRRCESAGSIRKAFSEAFLNIKPIDAVVVGMFPKYENQVYENVRIVEDILRGD